MKEKIKKKILYAQKLAELFESSVDPAVIFSDNYIKSSFISSFSSTAF